jgi:hypothetical protein
LVELEGFKGKSFGVVTGRGLNTFEAISIPFLLKSSAEHFLWGIAGAYVLLLSGWLAFVSRFRSLHMDLLAWSRFMSADTASRLGLLPISNGNVKDHLLGDIVTVVLSVSDKTATKKRIAETLARLTTLSGKLQDDGWIAQVWNSRQVVASRPLSGDPRYNKSYLWSPTNVTDYLSALGEFVSISFDAAQSASFGTVVWVIGDLQIRAGRMHSDRAATIVVSGSSILEALKAAEEIGSDERAYDRTMMYPVQEAEDAGLKIVGERVSVNTRMYGKLELAARHTVHTD